MAGRSGRAAQGRPAADRAVRAELLRLLDDTFARRNWGHQGLRGAARGMGVAEASWIPPGGVHSIWQHLNHIAHWRRYILERVRGRHPRTSQRWPQGGRTVAELRRTQAELAALYRGLRAAVRRLPPGALIEKRGSRYPLAQLLLGEIGHMSYHTGQILLARRLYRQNRRTHGRPPR